MNCKDCKFWKAAKPEGGSYHAGQRSGGWCQNTKLREYGPFEPDALVYSYEEGGGFWTGPMFGCVHYTAPDAEAGQ